MFKLVRICQRVTRIVSAIGGIGSFAMLCLIVVTIFDVVTRRFFVLGSTLLQELEWHFHTVLFAMALGWAYVEDSHVRIDIIRDRLTPRRRLWVEAVGTTLFLIPYCALIIYFGIEHAHQAWTQGETSPSVYGVPYRWIIKTFIPFGYSCLLLVGLAILVQKLTLLFGRKELHRDAERIAHMPREHKY
jgi:TRAP-type mannitol/chloroaromatic compound transport system permease small subunit